MGTVNLQSLQTTFTSFSSSLSKFIADNALTFKMIGFLIVLAFIILPIAKYIGYIILGVNIMTGIVYCVNENVALEILARITEFSSSFLSVTDNVTAAIIKVTTQSDSNSLYQALGSLINFWYNLASSLELKWRILLYIIYAYMFTVIANELILLLICINSILIIVNVANADILPNLFSDENIKQFKDTVNSIVWESTTTNSKTIQQTQQVPESANKIDPAS